MNCIFYMKYEKIRLFCEVNLSTFRAILSEIVIHVAVRKELARTTLWDLLNACFYLRCCQSEWFYVSHYMRFECE